MPPHTGDAPLLEPIVHEHYVQKPKLFKWRWVVLAVFCALQAFCSVIQMSFIGIMKQATAWWDVANIQIQLTGLVYALVPIFLTWVVIPLLATWGLAVSLFLGAGLNLVAVWVRFFARGSGTTNFWIMLSGQTLGAAAQVFVLNAVTLVACNWFGDKERALATSLGALWGILGQGIGFAMQAIVVGNDMTKIPEMVLIQAIMGSVISLSVFAFVRSQPPSPPTLASGEVRESGLKSSMKRCFQDKQFILLWFAFGLSYGTMIAFMTLISPIVLASDPSYGANFPSVLAAIAIGTGAVGAVLSAVTVDITKKHMVVVLVCGVGTVVTFVSSNFILAHQHMEIELYIMMVFGGLFGVAIIVLMYEVAVELTFPAPESASTSLLNLIGQIFGSGLGLGLNLFHNMVDAMYVITGAFGLSVIMLFCYRGEFRRTAFEAAKQRGENSDAVNYKQTDLKTPLI